LASTEPDPKAAAVRLVSEHDDQWIADYVAELHAQLGGRSLCRIMGLWRLNRAELGELFGVSSRTVSNWIADGVPPERESQVSEVKLITDLLERHLQAGRIPDVVRRDAPGLSGWSLRSMVADGQGAQALALTRRMFAFGDA
jgi:hypothetical protein